MSQARETRVVVVTGAAGNLGRAIAAALARDGSVAVLVDRSLEHLRAAYPGPPSTEGRVLLGDVDLADEPAFAAALAPIRERLGAIDGLVSAVGAYRAGAPAHEEALETWDLLLRANVRTALVAARAILPGMLERGRGAIVNVASRDALAGPPGAAAYAASKAALLRLSESLAHEAKSRGVTVNSVLPGTLDTPQNRSSLPETHWPSLVEPAAVADVISFLVSPAARAVTGAAIPVYGRA